jgi:hypothetical protein
MSFTRRGNAAEPLVRYNAGDLVHQATVTRPFANGTLSCPACDAPLALMAPTPLSAATSCSFCGHAGAVRDFLSLATPTRPARVALWVRLPRHVDRVG